MTPPHQSDSDTTAGIFKMFLAWLMTAIGAVTLQEWVMVVTLLFTLLQIYVLLRDKVFNRKV